MITVAAPASLLLAPGLSPRAKVIWLASHLVSPLTVANLQAATGGISSTSIRRGLSELAAAGWPAAGDAPSAATPAISIPADLLANRRVGAMGKVLYGILHLTPGSHGRQTAITYLDLGRLAGACSITIQMAAAELRQAGWLKLIRARPRQPAQFTLLNPVVYRQRLELTLAKRRISRSRNKGEALMRELLSLLVDSTKFSDEDAPGFMVNPATGELLRFDRYYAAGVALEFNGAQHYGTTDWFPDAEEVKAQQLRDLLKAGHCLLSGIRLIILRAEDLSLDAVRAKIDGLLPVRDLTGHDLLVNYLIRSCFYYRSAAPPAQSTGAAG